MESILKVWENNRANGIESTSVLDQIYSLEWRSPVAFVR